MSRLFFHNRGLIILRKHKPKPLFKPDFIWLLRRPHRLTGFGFGAGLSPVAPGTFGTLVALPLSWMYLTYTDFPVWSLIIVGLLFFPVGIFVCQKCENDLGVEDYGGIVFDEIGAMIAILGTVSFSWQWWAAAFIVFRIFDAVKPFPISWFDRRFHGGFGIMSDDYIAALLSASVLWIAQQFL